MGINGLRIIVTGLVGLHPVGGVAWDYLQYVIGLSRLGYEVYYHEDTWSWPYHPLEKRHTSDGSYSAKYINDFFEKYAPELKGRWHYLHLHETSFGMSSTAFKNVAQSADIFLNVSGACYNLEGLPSKCVKVFLDTDPGYNQIILSEKPSWSENVERWCKTVADHDIHFTYAENIHATECLIPKLDFKWKTTRMPVVIDLWEPITGVQKSETTTWTTVMSWNAFKGKLVYNGLEYKSKGSEFEKLIELPRQTKLPLKIAVGGMSTPFKWLERHGWEKTSRFFSYITRAKTLRRLERYGWQVVDGPSISVTPGKYQEFITESRGEVSTAKNVYVALRSGWFSCRSACYLAAGKPVVVQDTGFGNVFPTGEGLFAFNTMEEILTAFEAVNSDYERHSRAARDIAEEYFSAEIVLTKLLNDLGL